MFSAQELQGFFYNPDEGQLDHLGDLEARDHTFKVHHFQDQIGKKAQTESCISDRPDLWRLKSLLACCDSLF
jgi:hypothetical protein